MTAENMQGAGDTDWFKLDLTAGDAYTVKTSGLAPLTFYDIVPQAAAADLPVTVVATGLPSANGEITFTADTTGAYEFSAADYGGFTGAYTISAAKVANTYTLADGVTLAVGRTDKATMQAAGDTDWFKISLTAGKTYTFRTAGLDEEAQYDIVPAAAATDVAVTVRPPALPSSNGWVTFTADKTGVYEFSATDPSGHTGAYTLTAAVATNTYALADGVKLAVGGVDKATMQAPGDTDWFKVSLTAGDTYNFRITRLGAGAQYDIVPVGQAIDRPVTVQASGSDTGVVTFTADATGVYEFSASDPNGYRGAYDVSPTKVTNNFTLAKHAEMAANGYAQKATMQAAGDTDWFRIYLVAGETYTFKTTGLDALALYQIVPSALAGDRPVDVREAVLPSSDGMLTFTADTNGAYEFSVSDASGRTGAYARSATKVANTYTLTRGVRLAVGETDKATMQAVGDTDWFKINLTAGKTYTFTTTGLDSAAVCYVGLASLAVDSAVTVLPQSLAAATGTTTFTADTTGAYEVEISDPSGFTGAYTISAKVVVNTDTLARAVTLPAEGVRSPTGAVPFAQAMAGIVAEAAAQHDAHASALGGFATTLASPADGRTAGGHGLALA